MISSIGAVGGANVIGDADCFTGAGGGVTGAAAGFAEAAVTGGVTGRNGPDCWAIVPPTKINPHAKLAANPMIPKCSIVLTFMIFPAQSSAIELEYSCAAQVA